MAIIDFKKLIIELSDESFIQFRDQTEPYVWSYFLEKEEITKPVLLEKIGEYLKNYEIQSGKRDNDLAFAFSSYLIPYVENRVIETKKGEGVPNTAERYLKRLRLLNKQILSVDSKEKLTVCLEDFVKVFICLYAEYIGNDNKPIRSVEFHISKVKIDEVIDYLADDIPTDKSLEELTPEAARKIIPANLLKGADDLRKGFADMSKGLQDVQKGLSGEIKKMFKKDDTVYEPVHDFIEKCERENLYTSPDFVSIMLRLLYLRVRDYEQGRN